jgi:enediyne polyketide synthase
MTNRKFRDRSSGYQQSHDIAIIGMACWYPGAQNLLQLWENILTKRQQFRKMLDGRLPLSDYHTANRAAPDKTYGDKASFLEGFEFDWMTEKFPQSTFDSTDIVHWLALDVASKSIQDAGMNRKNIPPSKTGVIVGNSLTGEFSRANGLRMRWPYIQKVLMITAKNRGLSAEQTDDFIKSTEELFKSLFAPVTEDTLAGSLANTIAGRICNYFNLDGGGFTVDGACASSLLAIANSATALITGDLDLAIVGGVDVSLDTFELIGFAKVGALAEKEMRVYDRDGKGFLPGEGCGFVLLKRLEDAIHDKNKIYAVLKGWGISSDGSGGITAPKASGQSLALQRAYQKAGYKISACSFIEGHGTGTAVGDKRELEGISLAMNEMGDVKVKSCGMTSLKSIVGHTKAAAGIGAFIKAVIGVNRRVLPPTAGCENPNAIFDGQANMLFPLIHGEVKSPTEILRAGISAMGFGGINCHATVESYGPPAQEFSPNIPERALMVSHSDAELFVFTAQSIASLKQQVQTELHEAPLASSSEITDLAGRLARKAQNAMPYRAALLAASPNEYFDRLNELEKMLTSPPAVGKLTANELQTIWISNKTSHPRVGFLFPGQGSQKINMAKVLNDRFSWASDLTQNANEWLKPRLGQNLSDLIYRPVYRSVNSEETAAWSTQLAKTEFAQPAICLSSLLWARRLTELGVQCDSVAGHSLGELTALHWAGAFQEKDLLELAALRGHLMSAPGNEAGAMVSLTCDRISAEKMIEEFGLKAVVANINGPQQVVLSGTKTDIDEVIKAAGQKSVSTHRLNVSNAFHSILVSEAAKKFKNSFPILLTETNLKYRFVSGSEGNLFTHDIRLQDYLSKQIVSPVNFVDVVNTMASQCDLMIEVGHGSILSGLTKSILGKSGPLCLPVEAKFDQQIDLLRVIGHYFAYGGQVNFDKLFSQRLVRDFTSFSDKKFLINPCEKAFPEDLLQLHNQRVSHVISQTQLAKTAGDVSRTSYQMGVNLTQAPEQQLSNPTPNVIPINPSIDRKALSRVEVKETMLSILCAVTGFPVDIFKMDMRLLDDLNLDSIKAGEVITKIAKKCSIESGLDPIQIVNATLDEIIDMVTSLRPSLTASPVQNVFTIPLPHNQSATPLAKKSSGNMIPSIVLDREKVKALFIEILCDVTGFPSEIFKMEMRLLDDLNLDSIKAGEVITSVAQKCSIEAGLDPIQIVNATLDEIIDIVFNLVPKTSGSSGSGSSSFSTSSQTGSVPPAENVAAKSALQILTETTSRISGYNESSFSPDMQLLNELRVPQKKFEEIIHESCLRLGIRPNLDIQALNDVSIQGLSSILENLKMSQMASSDTISKTSPTDSQTVTKFPEPTAWVRNFVLEMVQSPQAETPPERITRHNNQWTNAKILLIKDDEYNLFSDALRERWTLEGSSVTEMHIAETSRLTKQMLAEFNYILCLLPEQTSNCLPDVNRVQSALQRLHFLTTIPNVFAQSRRATTVGCVQFGDGRFSSGKLIQNFDQASVSAFLQSLHLERSDMRVRSIEIGLGLDLSQACTKILAELITDEAFKIVGFTLDGQRLEPRLKLSSPASYKSRNIFWNKQDVMLVTGGAKGITTECALAFAKQTGVKLAIVGSSALPDPNSPTAIDNEVLKNLERFRKASVDFKYYSCDVSDEASVLSLVAQIEKDLGPVSAVLHGAGKNIPRRLGSISAQDAYSEVAPKLLGAINLCKALPAKNLKLFSAFTSILGLMGVQGNGWYSFSNEALNLVLARYREQNPHIAVVACAFGMWHEVGMAAKLGSGEKFSAMGVRLIPVAEGVRRYLNLVTDDPGAQQVVVTARLWKQSWIQSKRIPAKSSRFLGDSVNCTDGVETISRVRLSLEKDLYLQDHKYAGVYLFPTVFGLEAMAQVAAHTFGIDRIEQVIAENVDLNSAIAVDPKNGTEIEIYAEIQEQTENSADTLIKVGVRSEASKFKKDCFSATLRIPKEIRHEKMAPLSLQKPLQLDLHKEIYGPLLFHGPAYQRIQAFYQLNSTELIFSSLQENSDFNQKKSFAADNQTLMIGDPFFRDTLLQSCQCVATKLISLPIACEKWEIFSTKSKKGEKFAHYNLLSIDGKKLTHQVVCVDQDGNILERLTKAQSIVTKIVPQNPSPEDLAAKGLQTEPDVADHLSKVASANGFLSPTLIHSRIPDFSGMSITDRHFKEKQVFTKALEKHFDSTKDFSEYELLWKASGKPYVQGGDKNLEVSFSHVGDECICLLSENPIGCDLENILEKTNVEWEALLGPTFAKLFRKLCSDHSSPKDINFIGTSIWSAREAAGKVLDQHNFSILEGLRLQTGFKFKVNAENKNFNVFVFTHSLETEKNFVIATAVLLENKVGLGVSELSTEALKNTSAAYSIGFLQEKGFFARWPVSFKDASSIHRKIYFAKFFEWQGRARELAILPILGECSEIFGAGDFGWVTNHSEVQLFKSAQVGDVIEARLTSGKPHGKADSSIEVFYDWYRLDGKGREELIAQSHMLTTWVKIISHGIVEVASFPDLFLKFFSNIARPDVQRLSPSIITGDYQSIYHASAGVSTGPILSEQVFQTSLEDSNLVGNIYFSNYSGWLGRTRDMFFHRVTPEMMQANAPAEFFCTKSLIKHLRELMPFDKVQVVMRLKGVGQNGLKLYFEFFKFVDGKRGEKIAFADHDIIWAESSRDHLIPAPLPALLVYYLRKTVQDEPIEVKFRKTA